MDNNKTPVFNGRSDHDLLIEAITKLDRAITDIKEMDRNFTKNVADKLDRDSFSSWGADFRKDMERDLEEIQTSVKDGFKAVEKREDDFEIRIRRLERWGFVAIGSLAAVQFIIGMVK